MKIFLCILVLVLFCLALLPPEKVANALDPYLDSVDIFIAQSVVLPIFIAAVSGGLGYFFSSVRKRYIGEETREKFAKGLEAYKSKNYSEAIQIWRPLADINYGNAKGLTAKFRFLKSKLKKSWEGYAEAQYYMGVMYNKGFGIIQDYDVALEWYKKGSEQGHAESQNCVGKMYKAIGDEYKFKGEEDNAEKEYKEAVLWFSKAANQGNANGQNNLGFMHDFGLGFDGDSDSEVAFEWYRKSAEQAHSTAQNNIGYMYYRGIVPENENIDYKKEALKWVMQSARQGDELGQYNLAGMYLDGDGGLTQSNIHAYKWFYLAKENKDEYAMQILEDLEEHAMTKEDIDKAIKLAKKCLKTDYEDCGEE